MTHIHIGYLIQQELQRQEHTVSWLARKLSCDRSNVYRIFQKDNIDCVLLLSKALNYNFFKLLSDDSDGYVTKIIILSGDEDHTFLKISYHTLIE